MKKQNQSMKYKSAIVGETIAFSIWNKPFKPLGMIPTNILKNYVVVKQRLPYKHMVQTS
jgi:hypothetical protein